MNVVACGVVVLCGALTASAGAPGLGAARFREAARQAPVQPRERPVPFRPGETLVYDVAWSSYLTAGTVTLTVQGKRPSNGSTAYAILAEARPTPLLSRLYTLYYRAETLLDAYTLLPQRGTVYSEEGRRRRTKVTRFDHAERTAHYEVRTATLVKETVQLPPYAQDALSALYVLRALRFRPGETVTMPVSDSGRAYTVRITVGGREAVDTGLGEILAWRLTPVIVQDGQAGEGRRDLVLWLSDDARRLPVKVRLGVAVGSFTLTLREVTDAPAPARGGL